MEQSRDNRQLENVSAHTTHIQHYGTYSVNHVHCILYIHVQCIYTCRKSRLDVSGLSQLVNNYLRVFLCHSLQPSQSQVWRVLVAFGDSVH